MDSVITSTQENEASDSGMLRMLAQRILSGNVSRHAKNLSWMFFGKIATVASSLVATALIARQLGPSNFGQLSYALSFSGIFSFLASLGIDQILVRELSRRPTERNTLLGTSLTLSIFAGILAFFCCASFAFAFSPKDISFPLILIISTGYISGSFMLIGYEFQTEHRAKWPTILTFTIVSLINLLKIGIAIKHCGVYYLATLAALEPILYAVGYSTLHCKFFGKISSLKFSTGIAKEILRDSLPLIFVSAFAYIYSRIDQVLLKNFINEQSVGEYDAAVRLSEFWYFIPNIVISGLIPVVIRAKEQSQSIYIRRGRQLTALVMTTTILFALMTTIFAEPLTMFIYGSKFSNTAPLLRIYIWSNIGTTLAILTQQILLIERLGWLILMSTSIGALVNIILCFVLIPKMGNIGAAYASLIAYIVPPLSLLFIPKARKIIFNFTRKTL